VEYKLKIGEETFPVEADIKDDNNLVLTVGDDNMEVTHCRISDHRIHLAIDGRRVDAYVADEADGKSIIINGFSYSVADLDVLEQKKAGESGVHNIPDEITPGMPSVVVSVLVKVNDKVEKEQGLVVLSAMKMETTLYAPYSGKVTKVNAAKGDKVMPGDILIEIEKDQDDA